MIQRQRGQPHVVLPEAALRDADEVVFDHVAVFVDDALRPTRRPRGVDEGVHVVLGNDGVGCLRRGRFDDGVEVVSVVGSVLFDEDVLLDGVEVFAGAFDRLAGVVLVDEDARFGVVADELDLAGR